jgi:hypothetical protein
VDVDVDAKKKKKENFPLSVMQLTCFVRNGFSSMLLMPFYAPSTM